MKKVKYTRIAIDLSKKAKYVYHAITGKLRNLAMIFVLEIRHLSIIMITGLYKIT